MQDNLQTSNGFNAGRLKILNHYFQNQKVYDLDHLIELLRTSNGPEYEDYAKNAYLTGVCNYSGLQMVIFSSKAKGIYLATGHYYAARNEVQFYPDDFRKMPSHYKTAVPLKSVVEKGARLLNMVAGGQRIYRSWSNLAKEYPKEAFIQEYAGWAALDIGKKPKWAARMQKSWELQPNFPEYRVLAASGAFYFHRYQQVITLLKSMDSERLNSIKYQVLRLKLLAQASHYRANDHVQIYLNQLHPILEHDPELNHWLEKFMGLLK